MLRVASSRRSALCLLWHATLAVFGFVLLLLGIAMSATFWLLPVGLPLGLLGAACMGAAGESPQIPLGSDLESVVLGPEESVRESILVLGYETGTPQVLGALLAVPLEDQESILVSGFETGALQGLGALRPAPLEDQALS